MLRRHNLLMNTAGEGDGGGGAGSSGNSSGAGAAGGGEPSLTSGAAAGGAGANSSSSTTNDKGASGGAGGNTAADWKAGLPPELQSDPSITSIRDVATLAQNYLHTKRLVGSEKIIIPGKHATDEDWKQVYSKLGLPEKIEDYKVDFDEKALDKGVIGNFITEAHKMGVLPKQAQGLVQWFAQSEKAMREQMTQQMATQRTQGFDSLKEKWGAKYDQNLASAGRVLAQFLPKEKMAILEQRGLDKDPLMFEILGSIGETMFKEDSINGGPGTGGGALSPAEAQAKINSIMSDQKGPYWNKSHPNHQAAVQEMADLYKMKAGKR